MHKLSRINADVMVEDGDVISVGTVPIKVIHTPGHTPDSICLLVDNKIVDGRHAIRRRVRQNRPAWGKLQKHVRQPLQQIVKA